MSKDSHVPDERDYMYEFAEGIRLRARFLHSRGFITKFLIQLEKRLEDDWQPVIRYDNAHGQPHMDILDRNGRQISKQWLYQANNEALTAALNDIKAHWREYIERYMKDDWR